MSQSDKWQIRLRKGKPRITLQQDNEPRELYRSEDPSRQEYSIFIENGLLRIGYDDGDYVLITRKQAYDVADILYQYAKNGTVREEAA